MKKLRCVAGLAALLSLVGCASTKSAGAPEPDEATVVESKEGGFSVQFPFPVQEEHSEQPTSAGPLTLHTFVATDPEHHVAYYLSYTDFPPDAVARVDSREVVERASLGAVDSLGATDVSSRAVVLDGIPGQEVTATAGEHRLRGRFFMVGPRLYQQLLIHPVGQAPREAERFFSSFRVHPEAAQALGGSGRPPDEIQF